MKKKHSRFTREKDITYSIISSSWLIFRRSQNLSTLVLRAMYLRSMKNRITHGSQSIKLEEINHQVLYRLRRKKEMEMILIAIIARMKVLTTMMIRARP